MNAASPSPAEAAEPITYRHRPALDHDDLQALFERAWGERKGDYRPVLARSFTWVAAYAGRTLVGFVNVAWDGGGHFFLLDTTVHPDWQRRGIATALVREAIADCRGRGEWLHVDASHEVMAFYRRCGFADTSAGLLALTR